MGVPTKAEVAEGRDAGSGGEYTGQACSPTTWLG